MGHLINPIAMRMGWSTNWMDVFFSDFKYYPFYLHLIYRLRLLLIMLFDRGWFENSAFFYSHFLLSKTYNGLQVQVYFYDGICESFVYYLRDFIKKDKHYMKSISTWKTFHERKKKEILNFLFVFNYLLYGKQV